MSSNALLAKAGLFRGTAQLHAKFVRLERLIMTMILQQSVSLVKLGNFLQMFLLLRWLVIMALACRAHLEIDVQPVDQQGASAHRVLRTSTW
jgi:hypothetical protein